jgi:tetratricopeptide (TPR) repeat protein
LQGIGTIQSDMGEYVGADSTYSNAARIYVQLGRPRDAALARIAQADAAVRMGDMKLALTALQQSRDMPGRPVDDAELDARMDEIAGWIAQAHGDAAAARDFFRNSRAQAVKAFGANHVKVVDALRGQVSAEGLLRNFDEALRLLDLLEATAAKAGGDDARMLPGLAKERANLLLGAGHFAQSLDQVMMALPKCVSDLGPNHSECRELMFSKANAMLRLGMQLEEGDRRSLLAIADDQSSPALGADTLLLILKSDSQSGSAATFERVRAFVESLRGAAVGPAFKPKALLALAETRLRLNDPVEAERLIGKAVALQRRSDGSMPVSASGAFAKSLQGISLLLRGRDADALDSLRAAQEETSKLLGPDNPATRLCSLNAALALELLGRSNEALAIVERAEPLLHKAMGDDAPAYLRVKALQRRLEQSIALGVGSPTGLDPSVTGARAKSRPRIDFFS